MKRLLCNGISALVKPALFLGLLFPLAGYAQQTMKVNLYSLSNDGSTHLMDGNMTNYNNMYSNLIDQYDAIKMVNPEANFGIFRLNTNLSVERRQALPATDTTYFKMWNMSRQNYRVRFVLQQLNNPNTIGYLYDSYLDLEVPIGLNDTTYYDFSVNNEPASSNMYRFTMIYSPRPPRIYMPIMWEASLDNPWNPGIWSNGNKVVMEKSTDGIQFNPIRAHNSSLQGSNHRLSFNRGGGTVYFRANFNSENSAFANDRKKEEEDFGTMTVFPNPVTGHEFSLRLQNQPAGKYHLSLIGTNGTRYLLPALVVNGRNEVFRIQLPQILPSGIYQLQIITPKVDKTIISLNVR